MAFLPESCLNMIWEHIRKQSLLLLVHAEAAAKAGHVQGRWSSDLLIFFPAHIPL